MNYQDLFVEKYRPRKLEDMILQPQTEAYFSKLIEQKNIPNLLLYGKPGGGKTTLARVVARELDWETLELNASDENGVDTIREKVATFCNTASLDGAKKLVIFEEADGLSSAGGNGSSAQQILKNLIEESSDTVRFIMTVNDISKMDAAIKSRMECINIVPPNDAKVICRKLVKICRAEGINFDVPESNLISDTVFYRIYKDFYPDVRKMVDCIQRHSLNDDHKLLYDGEETAKAEVLANDLIDGLLHCFFYNPVEDGRINAELINLRSYVISMEDSFGADYHAVMKRMVLNLVNRKQILESEKVPGAMVRELILEIQDRMKWYSMVLDKELHFFAMLISLAKIMHEYKKDE